MKTKIHFRAAPLAAIALSLCTFGLLRAQTETGSAPQPEAKPAPVATTAPEKKAEAKTEAPTPPPPAATNPNTQAAPTNTPPQAAAPKTEELTPTGRPDANAAPKADSPADRAATAVRVAFEDNADLSGYDLEVMPQGDHVVVRGTVGDADLKRQATEAAFAFSGSVKVDVQVKARQ